MTGGKTAEVHPKTLVQMYQRGDISSGHDLRSRFFAHVVAADTDEQKARVREALQLVPQMKWDDKHRRILTEKGLV